jgi:integrase
MAGRTSKKLLLAANDAVIKATEAIDKKPTEYGIDGHPGLRLLVQPKQDGGPVKGHAAFVFRYSIQDADGARTFRRSTLGSRLSLTLKAATIKARELSTKLDQGVDPVREAAEQADAERQRKAAKTLRQMFTDRVSKDDRRAAGTLAGYQEAMERDVFTDLGDLPAAEITAEQIARVLEVVEKRSKWQAHKARSALGSTYRWAIKRRVGGVRVNPVAGLGFTHKGKARKRLPTSSELAMIWKALDSGNLTKPMQLILKLAILTGQRLGQVVGARLSELESIETANPLWRIPAERMKVKDRDQILPLSVEAAVLFKQAIALAGDRAKTTGCAFPADIGRVAKKVKRTPRTPHINRESASRAMDRLCDHLRKDFKIANPGKAVPLENLVLHDMRKAVTTHLRETHRTPSDVCDLILHHSKKGVTGSHYDFAILEGPVREAMQRWADHVAVITGQRAAHISVDNVRQIRAPV